MTPENFKRRTQKFAVDIIRYAQKLRGRTGSVISWQLIKAGTSVGANYRAACRARSRKEFIAKMGIVEEECDECLYWLEVSMQTCSVELSVNHVLMREGGEILAMVTASIKTSRFRRER